MKTVFRLLVAVLAGATCLSALAAVTASLDRDQVALGETVQLLLQSDDAGGQPDVAPLRQDFDVLGSSRGSSLQIINGHSSSQTQVNLLLAPKHAGTIRIPPLQWGTGQSPALELTVSGNGNNSNNSSSDQDATAQAGSDAVFLTATLDQKQPYVQQPVVLTVRLHAAVTIDQASLDLAGNSDVLVKQIGKDTQSGESRNGRNYQVIERRYLLIPQRSGRISLKGPVLDAQVQGGGSGIPDLDALLRHAFGGNPLGAQLGMAHPVHLTGNSVELNVLPRPAAATGANWLPAQQLTLEETWRSDYAPVHVGDPVTRHVHLAAVGLTGAQLPEIGTLMSVPDGIKMYPDQAKVDEDTNGSTVTGSRDQDIAFIANRPGHYVLPAVRLAWWDTKDKVQREARLPARTLDVLPAAGGSAAAAMPAPATGSQPPSTASGNAPAVTTAPAPKSIPVSIWQWVSAVLALLWLGTMLAWWASYRRAAKARSATPPTAQPSPKTAKQAAPVKLAAGSALSALQRACRDNDAQAARRYVLEWAAGFWPDSPPRGLNAVAERLADSRFIEPLRALDRACYMGSAWQGDALAQAFAVAPKAAPSAKAGKVLPDLYS
jgi:hypothetical protein